MMCECVCVVASKKVYSLQQTPIVIRMMEM